MYKSGFGAPNPYHGLDDFLNIYPDHFCETKMQEFVPVGIVSCYTCTKLLYPNHSLRTYKELSIE